MKVGSHSKLSVFRFASLVSLSVAIVYMVIMLSPKPAVSVTAWARKYGANCSMCHVGGGYRLNATGKEFLKRGHRMEGETANEEGAWKNLSDYLSITQKVRYSANTTAATGNRPAFDVEALSLYGGGVIDRNFSFFLEQYLHESNAAGADREKLAEAYGMYTSGDGPTYTTVRAGQIGPYLVHTLATGGRTSISRSYIFNDSLFASNIPYQIRQRQYGVEGAANWDTLYGALGVVNGTGHKIINAKGDTNGDKDLYLTLEKTFDDHGSSVGLYGYSGTWQLAPSLASSFSTTYTSTDEVKYKQYGILANFNRENFTLLGAYLPGGYTIAANGTDKSNVGYMVEGQFHLNPDFSTLYARYDAWDPNTATSDDAQTQLTAGVTWRIMEAGRLAVEEQTTALGTAVGTTTYTAEFQWMY